MTIVNMIKSWWFLLIIFTVIDISFLSTQQARWQQTVLTVQKEPMSIRLWAGALCYLVIAFGLYYFVVLRFSESDAWKQAFLFGLVLYAVFDLTNLAIFANYDMTTAVLDILWGGVASAVSVALFIKLSQFV